MKGYFDTLYDIAALRRVADLLDERDKLVGRAMARGFRRTADKMIRDVQPQSVAEAQEALVKAQRDAERIVSEAQMKVDHAKQRESLLK